MLRRSTWAALIAGSILAGCQPAPAIYVLNNSGMELRVRGSRQVAEGRWEEKIVSIKPGLGETFRFVKALSYPEPTLRVQIGGCEVTYEMPPLSHRYDYRFNMFGLRLEPDLTVHQILPKPAAGVDPQEAVHPGFPLKPASRVCP